MGGKKKTKWKKVSLAEFTKEIQKNDVAPSKINNQEGLAAGLPKEEEKETFLPLTEEVTENCAPYTIGYGEYTDGFWYPTSYVTYNPELVVPGNYFMPIDSCYYYYTPEIPTVQEYVPAPYQDYSTVK
ncbi:uncharacterized protein LOC118184687, partial [Stegodyphus dumicola]|uniref:uncharacterized protein LOC118184687 n=1 Tax=Stegodyphus dumicola TaxID=202533 RepID=UPI0015AE10CD